MWKSEKKNGEGILVISNIFTAESIEATAKLVSEACKLAGEVNTYVNLCLFGNVTQENLKFLRQYGAKVIYIYTSEARAQESIEYNLETAYQLIDKCTPEIVLFPTSLQMKSIAPRLAARLHTGLTADCLALRMGKKGRWLEQVRPAFNGDLLATIICPHTSPQMATVHASRFELKKNLEQVSYIEELPVLNNVDLKCEIFDKTFVRENKTKGGLSGNSDIVVSYGRGAEKEDNLNLILEFANLIGARVGATRAAVALGLADTSQQIGLTGKEVKCRVYFAFGIEGAIQHMAGLRKVQTLIAVNSDKNANIIKAADYAIIGKIEKILPLAIQSVKGMKNERRWEDE